MLFKFSFTLYVGHIDHKYVEVGIPQSHFSMSLFWQWKTFNISSTCNLLCKFQMCIWILINILKFILNMWFSYVIVTKSTNMLISIIELNNILKFITSMVPLWLLSVCATRIIDCIFYHACSGGYCDKNQGSTCYGCEM
jgi:hypothetical protein